MSDIVKIGKMIPIGVQKYAYQCIGMNDFIAKIEADINSLNRGGLPYPNTEMNEILRYELEIKRFTSNAIEIYFQKVYKDGSKIGYLLTTSFEEFVNQIFNNKEVNVFHH
jgi:hypothetical protein